MKLRYHLFSILVFLVSILSVCQSAIIDRVSYGDTIEAIAQRNIKRVVTKYGNDLDYYIKDIKKWNPNISDWDHLPVHQLLYLDYPYSEFVTGATWTPTLGLSIDRGELYQNFSVYNLLFSSVGMYSEKADNQELKSKQNFPLTIGLGSSYTNDEKKHFLLSGLTWSKATSANIQGNSQAQNQLISTPSEMGINLHYQYYLKDSSLGMFGGYDFDQLNTINTSEIVTGSEVKNISNNLHFVSAGFAKNFNSFGQRMSIKLTLSQTISSSASGGQAFTGEKFQFLYTLKPVGRFSLNVLYKHYVLTGASKLNVDRIGLGIGFYWF